MTDEIIEVTPSEQTEADEDLQRSRGDFVIDDDANEDTSPAQEEDNEGDDTRNTGEEEDEEGVDGSVGVDDDETETEDEGDEGEGTEDDVEPEDTKGIKIPKARLDQVAAQRDAERDRVKWLEDQLEKVLNNQSSELDKVDAPQAEALPPYDFGLAEEKYIELILDGEAKKAVKLRTEINLEQNLEMKQLIAETRQAAEDNAKSYSTEAVEEQKFSTTVEALESKYTFLDAESDDYNEEAVDTVNMLMQGMIADGTSKSQALSKAVKRISPMYTPAEEKKALGSTTGNKRAKAARGKAAAASKQQPASLPSSVKGSKSGMDDINVNKISEGQFNKLSKKELAVLRGDVV